jgi:hypothetical protein
MTKSESGDGRFKPADRRWNLVGMIVGTVVGALPAAIPAPAGPFVMWVAFGVLIGFMFPFGAMVHQFDFDDLRNPRKAWFLGSLGGVIGGLGGAIAWYLGKTLEPGMGICATCTGGFFAGFFVVDSYLKTLDARRLKEENVWQRPEIH